MSISFADAIHNSGLTPPNHIIADGVIHRFSTDLNKSSDLSGWYVYHGSYGAFGDWRSGLSEKWVAGSDQQYTPVKYTPPPEKKPRPIDQNKVRQAQSLWQAAKPADATHPYLVKKGVESYGLRVTPDNILLIPAYNSKGNLQCVQRIYPYGSDKKFLGPSKETFFTIGNLDDATSKVYICEGYATGASVYESSGITTIVAFTAGSLKDIALIIRQLYPNITIVIAGDDDAIHNEKPSGNVGVKKARDAAETLGCNYVLPTPLGNHNLESTDFNDLRDIDLISDRLATEYTPDNAYPIELPDIPSRSLVECRDTLQSEIMHAYATPGFYLHIGPPGIGKTQALVSLPDLPFNYDKFGNSSVVYGNQITIAVPTIKKADELAWEFNRPHIYPRALVIRGKDQMDTDGVTPMCKRANERKNARKKGCVLGCGKMKKVVVTDPVTLQISYAYEDERCIYHQDCPGYAQQAKMFRFPVHITTHANICTQFTSLWRNARLLVIDEDPSNAIQSDYHIKLSVLQESHKCFEFLNPEFLAREVSDLKESIALSLNEFIDSKPKQIRINANLSDTEIQDVIEQYIEQIPYSHYKTAELMLETLTSGRLNGFNLTKDKDGDSCVFISCLHKVVVKSDHVLGLDGTGNKAIWSSLLGIDDLNRSPDVIATECHTSDGDGFIDIMGGVCDIPPTIETGNATQALDVIEKASDTDPTPTPDSVANAKYELIILGSPINFDDYNVSIHQDSAKSFYEAHWYGKKQKATKDTPPTDIPPELLPNLIGRILQGNYDGIICQMELETKIKEFLPDITTLHFNNNRGMNTFEDCKNILIIGRVEPGSFAIEQAAGALWPYTPIQSGKYIRKTGYHGKELHAHIDPRCQMMLAQKRDNEVRQAISRIRPFKEGVKRKVTIWNTIPLNHVLPVKQIVDTTPTAVYRVLGKTKQGSVLPLSKHYLQSLGLDGSEIDAINEYAVNQFRTEFRVSGEPGPVKTAVIYNQRKAKEELGRLFEGDIEFPHSYRFSELGGLPIKNILSFKDTPPDSTKSSENHLLCGFTITQDKNGFYCLVKRINGKKVNIYVGKEYSVEIAIRKLADKGFTPDVVTTDTSLPESIVATPVSVATDKPDHPFIGDSVANRLDVINMDTSPAAAKECEPCIYNNNGVCTTLNEGIRQVKCSRYKTIPIMTNGVPEVVSPLSIVDITITGMTKNCGSCGSFLVTNAYKGYGVCKKLDKHLSDVDSCDNHAAVI